MVRESVHPTGVDANGFYPLFTDGWVQDYYTLNFGGEEIFLSGEFAGSDIPGLPPIPEPGTGLLMGLGLMGLAAGRRRNHTA